MEFKYGKKILIDSCIHLLSQKGVSKREVFIQVLGESKKNNFCFYNTGEICCSFCLIFLDYHIENTSISLKMCWWNINGQTIFNLETAKEKAQIFHFFFPVAKCLKSTWWVNCQTQQHLDAGGFSIITIHIFSQTKILVKITTNLVKYFWNVLCFLSPLNEKL